MDAIKADVQDSPVSFPLPTKLQQASRPPLPPPTPPTIRRPAYPQPQPNVTIPPEKQGYKITIFIN